MSLALLVLVVILVLVVLVLFSPPSPGPKSLFRSSIVSGLLPSAVRASTAQCASAV
jgi:hypothetical protein